MTAAMRDEAMSTINGYNSILPDLVAKHGAIFVGLPAMPNLHTIDGIHLNSDGYLSGPEAFCRQDLGALEKPGRGELKPLTRMYVLPIP